MLWLQYVFPVLLSCFTGWLVTWIAIKFLFHPHKPVSLPGFKLQGIFPKNQQAIAEQLGQMVSKELLSFSELKEKVTSPDNLSKLKPEIENHIDIFLREKLKDTFPMLSMFIGDKTINQLKAAFLLELESLFPVLMNSYMIRLEKDINAEKLVTEKVAGYSLTKAEEMLNKSAKKLFIYFQMTGVIIGLLTGLFHVLINMQVYS
jgi:uncharacterized membrane protein YheB (UPF0754 family)